jgi:hypothetical protein
MSAVKFYLMQTCDLISGLLSPPPAVIDIRLKRTLSKVSRWKKTLIL